jgi:hypothetical protein
MKYKENWQETKERFDSWWRRENTDRPLMRIVAKRKAPIEELESVVLPNAPEDSYLDVDNIVKKYRNFLKTHKFMAEAYPNLDLNLGAGSMALYLGSDPVFAWDTIWFRECVKDWHQFGSLRFNPENYWWKKHIELLSRAKELSHGDFLINIPDIIENVDILSAMRGPQEFCFDLIDEPDLIHDYVKQIDNLYFKYYDSAYDIVKDKERGSSYTAFNVYGSGKTAKVQCDFSALMSPTQFREFVQPSLRKQCKQLDHSIYHLDGPDAIRHLDALMEIEELDALQWTPGTGKPDGASEEWYRIYDKVRNADKSLWIEIHEGDFNQWTAGASKLVNRYGSRGLYLLFPKMEEEQAEELLRRSENNWK